MKKFFFVFIAFLVCALDLPAQTPPIRARLAIISDSPEATRAADLLTVKLSQNSTVELLERDQIEKIYREQERLALTGDYLKLGQILGADGLLSLNVVRGQQTTNLTLRLIAVKPGVILTDRSFAWPVKELMPWSDAMTADLRSLWPKLNVAQNEAIPISVINFRSAIDSAAAAETERQVKLLVIQRLSQEQPLFVLERQKLSLASEEKSLATDDSAFWNGSYLLEGTLDQNGYSPDTITINAQLTPPRGGQPLRFAINGSRTNLTTVINQLAAWVNEVLKIQSSVPAWEAADEASQFFKEAQWALQWGDQREAQSAADSAWVLGKKDLDCARVRVRAYLQELAASMDEFQNSQDTLSPARDANGNQAGPMASETEAQNEIKRIVKENPFGLVYRVHEADGARVIDYAFATQPPDPKNIDRARHVLELYYDFSRTSPPDESKILYGGDGLADWYGLGVEVLVAASKVLQSFNLVPSSQSPVADQLVELRAQARAVAAMIAETPSVRDSYFPGDWLANGAAADRLIGSGEWRKGKRIFDCEVSWGCLWQETPEDCIALYRRLMGSPFFSLIHNDLWYRLKILTPTAFTRVAGWTDAGRQRVDEVWRDYVQELNHSTNRLWQIEGQALAVADAGNDKQFEASFTALMDDIKTHGAELVETPANVFYDGGNFGELLEHWSIESPAWARLNAAYYTNYFSMLRTMESEHDKFIAKKIKAAKFLPVFEAQKEYLKTNHPYKFSEYTSLFTFPEYSTNQALELLPLVTAYKSNLMAQATSAEGRQKNELHSAIFFVGALENEVKDVINPPAPLHFSRPAPKVPPAPVAQKAALVSAHPPEEAGEIITVKKFLTIPTNGLPARWYEAGVKTRIMAHHWYGGKLLLDFEYEFLSVLFSYDDQGNAAHDTPAGNLSAIALFDPGTEHWEIVQCPEADISSRSYFYHRSVLWRDELFNSDGNQIRKYDPQNHRWEVLPVSDGNNYELFVVNERLYAANQDTIFEITDEGKGSRILASRKRQPPASVLDTQEWGMPVLFAGPQSSLRVGTGGKIFTWLNKDWREDFIESAKAFPWETTLFPDGALLRQEGYSTAKAISLLPVVSPVPELGLWQNLSMSQAAFQEAAKLSPLWRMPPRQDLATMAAGLSASNLYTLSSPAAGTDPGGNNYNACLLHFSHDLQSPQKLFLKFDAPGGCPPTPGTKPGMMMDVHFGQMPAQNAWLMPAGGFLIFGLERVTYPTYVDRPATYQAGIWLLPLTQLEPMIQTQSEIQIAQQARLAAAANQVQKELLAQYDRNRNGIIDPEEREDALSDSTFIKWQLDLIDTNHNGRLDLTELSYFAVKRPEISGSKKRAGIDIACHLLTERDLQKFDMDGDGLLDKNEFQELLLSMNWLEIKFGGGPYFDGRTYHYMECDQIFRDVDGNQDGKIDRSELESYMQRQMQNRSYQKGRPGFFMRPGLIPQGQTNFSKP